MTGRPAGRPPLAKAYTSKQPQTLAALLASQIPNARLQLSFSSPLLFFNPATYSQHKPNHGNMILSWGCNMQQITSSTWWWDANVNPNHETFIFWFTSLIRLISGPGAQITHFCSSVHSSQYKYVILLSKKPRSTVKVRFRELIKHTLLGPQSGMSRVSKKSPS